MADLSETLREAAKWHTGEAAYCEGKIVDLTPLSSPGDSYSRLVASNKKDADQHAAFASALTRAAEVVERIEAGLARIDGAWKACPVNQSPKNLPRCPRCGAADNQNCGLNITAIGALESDIREILTPKAGGGDHG